MAPKLEGRGEGVVKALVAGLLKITFYCGFPYDIRMLKIMLQVPGTSSGREC